MLKLKLIIPDHVYQKIMWWVNKSDHEVSGFGSLDYDQEKGVFTARDAILLKQEVGPTSTEIDPVSLGKAMYEMRAEPNALKWHWHSHVDMGVFWSADDRKLISGLGQRGWILATVFNKKCERKTAFSTVAEIKMMGTVKTEEFFIDDIPTTVERFLAKEETDQWDAQYAEHVKVEREWPTYPNGAWSGHWGDTVQFPARPGFVKESPKREVPTAKPDKDDYDYNEHGIRYSWKWARWVYNPIYDSVICEDDELIIDAVLTMDDAEVDSAIGYWDDKEKIFEYYYDLAVDCLEDVTKNAIIDADARELGEMQ